MTAKCSGERFGGFHLPVTCTLRYQCNRFMAKASTHQEWIEAPFEVSKDSKTTCVAQVKNAQAPAGT